MLKYYPICVLALITSVLACEANPVDKETQFWKWFVTNKTRIYEQCEQEPLLDEVATQLFKIDSNLRFEFSAIQPSGIREFTISADGVKKYFPNVESLVNKAPKIDKWKINAFRQRTPGDSLFILLDDRIKIGYQNIYFRYAHDSGKIALELNIENLSESPGFKNAVFLLLDGLIGEYDMETQISAIDFVKLDTNKIAGLSPLIALRSLVDKNKESQTH